MIIAVNTRLLLPGRLEGIGWVSYEILRRITVAHPEHKFYFLFDRKFSDEFIFSNNITPIVLYPQSRLPILWYLFFEQAIPKALDKVHADLFFSPDGWTSLNTTVPRMTVFHDLNFEYFPDFMPRRNLRYVKRNVPKYAKCSDKIIAVSDFTKNDITKLYNVDSDKIDVIYNAANSIYHPVSDDVKTETKNKFSNGCDYFVFVGSLHKRKNIINLLLAFEKFKKDDNRNIKLVIVGTKMWRKGDFETCYESMKYKNDVIFTGYLDAEQLSRVVASSIALTYVSIFEGFGIPIVEAFEAETAVITSNTTSMPEVAGDAAILIDPYEIDDIANAMRNVALDFKLRSSLIEKGKIQRNKFNWDNSAAAYWNSIEKLMNQPK